MNCKTASAALIELIDGTLSGPPAADLVAHLSSCARCRARRRALETAKAAFASLPREGAPAGFALRLARRLDAQGATLPERIREFLPAPAWAPVFASVAALALLLAGVHMRKTRRANDAPGVEEGGDPPGLNAGRLGYDADASPCSSARTCG